MKIIQIVLAIVITTFVSVSHAGILKLQVSDDGILLGAENVKVNDKFYNVTFQDTTCFLLYNGCNEVSDFVFNTQAAALAATEALLAQVFLDESAGLFDSDPSLTFGCVTSVSGNCVTVTPYDVDTFFGFTGPVTGWKGIGKLNSTLIRDSFPSIGFSQSSVDLSFVAIRQYNFAVWTAAEVPAPSAVILMLMSIGGLLVFRRTKES